jgi:aminobenzoyl-glutamate utilization protein B
MPICAAGAEAGDVIKFVDSRYEQTSALARDLWEFAEVGYQEVKSSTLIKEALAAEGFEIESGLAGIPTAFVASFGSKGPIIGILAEYDALPGINQDDVPTRSPIEGKLAGQACGHKIGRAHV